MRSYLLAGLAMLGLAFAEAEPADEFWREKAGIPTYAKESVFTVNGYVFAINVVADTGDVYIHMNAPSIHSWYGIGFGESMENSRMIVSYMAENKHNVTNSCRLSNGHREPVWDPDCEIVGVWHDIYGPAAQTITSGGTYITHIICKGCAKWPGGELDLTSRTQPFIYALGANVTLRSDRPDANLRLHEFHGAFTMDMVAATVPNVSLARIPAPQDPANQGPGAFWAFANFGSSLQYETATDAEWAPMMHGVFMVIAFLLIFPAGSLLLRTVHRAMWHAAAQLLGFFFVLVGFATAIYVSKMYNKSKNFNTSHQIIGLLIIAALCIQIGLGLTNHWIYLRTRKSSTVGQIHRFLGCGIIVLAIVNAGVGWNFAGNPYNNMPFGIVAGVVGLIFLGLLGIVLRLQRKRSYKAERESFVPQDYKEEPPAEYEMQSGAAAGTAPFAGMEARTPRWMESNDSLRNTSTRGTDAIYSDNPAETDRKNPATTQWQAVSGP